MPDYKFVPEQLGNAGRKLELVVKLIFGNAGTKDFETLADLVLLDDVGKADLIQAAARSGIESGRRSDLQCAPFILEAREKP
jgi:hypothetical protein